MQHTASPLSTEPALVTPPQGQAALQPAPQGEAQGPSRAVSRIGPDLSGAIERVLAWHRSRSRH